MISTAFIDEEFSEVPGMLDRLIAKKQLTGSLSEVIQVLRRMHGQVERIAPLEPQNLKESTETYNTAVYLASLYQQALDMAEQTQLHLQAHKRKLLKRQKRDAWLAKLAKLFALFSAYLAIDYQLQKEEDEKFRDYLKKVAENTRTPMLEKAIHAMADLIARVMEIGGDQQKAVRIVATTFVVTETVNNAIKRLVNSDDIHIRTFAEQLDRNEQDSKTSLISLVTEDVLTRNEREEKLRNLMMHVSESTVSSEETQTPVPPLTPVLHPEPLAFPRMDMLLEIRLMGLLRELGVNLDGQNLQNRLKIKARLLETMSESRPGEGLLARMTQDIDSVRQQMLLQLDANQLLQNRLAPPVQMPLFDRSRSMAAAMRPLQPTARPVLIPPVNSSSDDLDEELTGGKKRRLR
jgi:hypothetical protein